MVTRLAELASSQQEKMVERRRYMHQRPELSYQEYDTYRWVGERLR